MIELFSGIGAQKKGIDKTKLFDLEVVATSDIEKDAIASYASVHNGLTNDLINNYSKYPSEADMRKELIDKNIGFDFKKNSNPISKMKSFKLKKYWLAMKLSNNIGDISKIKNLPYADLWTYSFPCQSISCAGRQEGIIKGKTRSGLLYEVERLLETAKEMDMLPKYLLLENVKNLVGKKFKAQYDEWLLRLDELGYNTYWEITNAKNCGIPQNRERVFALSIRKDIDSGKFKFAQPYDLGIRLIDFLEDDVDEKYYIKDEKVKDFIDSLMQSDKFLSFIKSDNSELIVAMRGRNPDNPSDRTVGVPTVQRLEPNSQGICNTLTSVQKDSLVLEKSNNLFVIGSTQKNSYMGIDGISPTLTAAMGLGGGNVPLMVQQNSGLKKLAILRKIRTEYGKQIRKAYENHEIYEQRKNMTQLTPRTDEISNTLTTVQKDNLLLELDNKTNSYLIYDDYNHRVTNDQDNIGTLTTNIGNISKGNGIKLIEIDKSTNTQKIIYTYDGIVDKKIVLDDETKNIIAKYFKIRKLTPKECWRLMGFDDDDYEKALQIGLISCAAYKQAGNSIVTTCIAQIVEHLYKAQYDNNYICFDENFI